MALINCNDTFEVDIPGCIDTITLDLPLEITLTTVKYSFANGFTLSTKITTNITGIITLTKDTPLEGFWNEGTGPVTVQFFTGSKCDPEVITICGNTYSQIVLNFKPIQTNDTTFNINCTCAE
jgi:hypothetical protein